jgi:GGDEF domain-containing protein
VLRSADTSAKSKEVPSVGRESTLSAGKLHLLDLTELKARLGAKWARLSGHVEKFFEIAIRRSLGPDDSFARMAELSYVVLFRNLSAEEAQAKCGDISREVCERLFGTEGMEVYLRNVIGNIDVSQVQGGEVIDIMAVAEAALERSGREVIVSLSRGGDAIKRASSKQDGYLYRPLWDAQKKVVVTYLCQPAGAPYESETALSYVCMTDNEQDQLALNLAALRECAHRAANLRSSGLRVMTAVPVSFTTIARPRLWSAYADMRRNIPKEIARDLASLVLGIDHQVPNVRLGQELPKLSALAPHMFCLVDDSRGIAVQFSRTGPNAVGIALDAKESETRSIQRLRVLGEQTHAAGLDGFVLGIKTTSLVLSAMSVGIRYLEGPVIRPALDDPKYAYAQSLEHLYLREIAAGSSLTPRSQARERRKNRTGQGSG